MISKEYLEKSVKMLYVALGFQVVSIILLVVVLIVRLTR